MSKPIANAWYGITHYDDLKTENEALHDQIEHQKGAEIEAKTAINIANDLLKLYRLTSVRNIKGVAAQVIGEAPSNFQNTIEITVGSRDGVAVGMPVTDGAGLIGKVTKVYPDRSVVMLITDPQFRCRRRCSVVSTTTDASSTTSSTTPNTAPSGRPLGSDHVDEHNNDDDNHDTGVDDHHDDPPDGVTPGGTTTSSSSTTTSTTLPSFKVRRETGDIDGQGADRPLLFSLIDDTALTNVKVGDTSRRPVARRASRRRAFRSAPSPRSPSDWAAARPSSRWSPTPA